MLNCPACNSEQTQRLSAIVESGTLRTDGITTGAFLGTGRAGRFGGLTHGNIHTNTKSALVTRLSPPVRKREKRLIVFGLFFLWFGYEALSASGLVGAILLFLGIVLVLSGFANLGFNRNTLPELYARWAGSFYCHRCQHIYEPERITVYHPRQDAIGSMGALGHLPETNPPNRLT